jgi:integrase
MRGIELEDYDGHILIVRRSVWRKHIGAPKGKHGTGAVPVIAPLTKIIEQYLLQFGPKSFLFESMLGGPVSVEYIAREVIKPTLQAVGMEWHGWHAFRRGLATNLHALGISDIVIQAILRHSDVSVTRQSYIKRTGVDDRSVAAMKALESLICTKHAPEDARQVLIGAL